MEKFFNPKHVLKMKPVGVRYIVNDVNKAIDFYTSLLGFTLQMHPTPGFALLKNEDLHLYLNSPGAGGAGKAMPDDSLPSPGGWNRFRLEVDNLPETVERLQQEQAHFRNEIVTGKGGKQILLEDPSGNLIELFEPY